MNFSKRKGDYESNERSTYFMRFYVSPPSKFQRFNSFQHSIAIVLQLAQIKNCCRYSNILQGLANEMFH